MATLKIPPLRPTAPFTDKAGNLTKDAYDFLFGLYQRVGGSLDSLNAVTLTDATWDAPDPIGSTVPNTVTATTLRSNTTLVVGGGVTPSGSGLKHVRTNLTVGATTSALVTVTWPAPFADANYTVTASVVDSTASTVSLSVTHIETIAAGSVVVRVANTSAGSLNGVLHVIAMHD